MKGERKQQTRRRHGHQKSDDAAANREQDALRERLHNDLPGSGADGQPHGRLAATSNAASEQQIRDVGTGDQQHQAAHEEQDLQAATVFFFHHCDTSPRGYHVDDLFGKHADDVVHPVRGVAGIVLQPLAENSREAGGHPVGRSSRTETPDHAEPGRDGLTQQATFGVHHGFLLKGEPDVRRIAFESFAEESGGRDADHGHGMALDDER